MKLIITWEDGKKERTPYLELDKEKFIHQTHASFNVFVSLQDESYITHTVYNLNKARKIEILDD